LIDFFLHSAVFLLQTFFLYFRSTKDDSIKKLKYLAVHPDEVDDRMKISFDFYGEKPFPIDSNFSPQLA
jgi:hypothetical protein